MTLPDFEPLPDGPPPDPPPGGPNWHAVGFHSNGEVVPLRVYAWQETPDGRRMAAAVQNLGPPVSDVAPTITRHLSADATRALPVGGADFVAGIDPIARWAGEVEQPDWQLDGRIMAMPLAAGNRGVWFDPPSHLGCAAWHENCFAAVEVPSGLSHVLVVYGESAEATFNRRVAATTVAQNESASTKRRRLRCEVGIEWFSFLGDNTVALHGSSEQKVEAFSPGGGSLTLDVDGRGAILLRPWQWLGNRLDPPTRDPFFQDRLERYLRAVGSRVNDSPEISDARTAQLRSAMVWIHGTASCGLAALPDLPHLDTPLYRYEHDTFLDIDKNGADLADLLIRKLAPGPARVALIGHSRGGLVARHAAQRLARRPQTEIIVGTLGAPHLGTPIVNAGHRALRGLVAMTGFGLHLVNNPATMLMKYLLTYTRLPVGIKAMAVESDWLRVFNDVATAPPRTDSFGGDYQAGPYPESSGVRTLRRLDKLFQARGEPDNDLVVSTRSATAVGNPTTLTDSCGHFQYPRNEQVRDYLRRIAAEIARPRGIHSEDATRAFLDRAAQIRRRGAAAAGDKSISDP